MRKGLAKELEVLQISAASGLSAHIVAMTLIEFWGWADDVTDDGTLRGVTVDDLSHICPHVSGTFWGHVARAGWLLIYHDYLVIPNFDNWLGNSAKKRLKAALRKRNYRRRKPNVPLLSRSEEEFGGTREEKRRVIEEANASSCSELASPTSEPHVLLFPCVGKGPKEWALTAAKLAEYQDAFPGVDALAECRKALQWCRDNPRNRKTAAGMPRFLTNWLSRAQDKGVSGARPSDRMGRARVQAPPGKYDHFPGPGKAATTTVGGVPLAPAQKPDDSRNTGRVEEDNSGGGRG